MSKTNKTEDLPDMAGTTKVGKGNAKQKAKAKSFFAKYKDKDEVYILEDGNAFFDESPAKYAERLTKQKYTKFTR